jgi:hypothetical protein
MALFKRKLKKGAKRVGIGRATRKIGGKLKTTLSKGPMKRRLRKATGAAYSRRKITPGNFPTKSRKNVRGEIMSPTMGDIRRFNKMFTTTTPKRKKLPRKYK